MKVVVTGGAGFIGSHIVDALAESGNRVIVIDSLDSAIYSRPPDYLRRDVDYVFQDLRHWTPDARFDDVEGVVHLAALGGVARAAREPANVLGGNVGGTARLVEAALGWKHLRHVVVAGSFSVYGSNYQYEVAGTGHRIAAHRRLADLEAGLFEVTDPRSGAAATIVPITEAAVPSPLEAYGASKYMQELCFRGFTAAPVTVLRFSSVYGPRLRLDDGEATIIARLAGWVRDGVAPKLFEDGRQMRDWVYVGDVVAAATRILGGAAAPPIVNVCSGVPTTLTDATRILSDLYGRSVTPEVVGGFRPGDMRHCLGDPSTLAALIGRAPVPFRDGAQLTFGGER